MQKKTINIIEWISIVIILIIISLFILFTKYEFIDFSYREGGIAVLGGAFLMLLISIYRRYIAYIFYVLFLLSLLMYYLFS
jgi:hypothetical protein